MSEYQGSDIEAQIVLLANETYSFGRFVVPQLLEVRNIWLQLQMI